MFTKLSTSKIAELIALFNAIPARSGNRPTVHRTIIVRSNIAIITNFIGLQRCITTLSDDLTAIGD